MLYFWITTAVHRAQRQESTPSRFGPRPKGRMRRKNHFSSESSLDKMATSSSTGSAVTTPSKASSPSPLVGSAVAYSRSSSGGSTTLPEKSLTSKRKASTTSLTLWLLISEIWMTDLQFFKSATVCLNSGSASIIRNHGAGFDDWICPFSFFLCQRPKQSEI